MSQPPLWGTKHFFPRTRAVEEIGCLTWHMKPVLGTMQRAEAGSLDAWLPPLSYLTRALSGSRGLCSLQARKGQSILTELPHPPWVRMTVIFVAENVESHGFLLPFTHPPTSAPQ